MNPKCTLPEPMQRDALLQFDRISLTGEEEQQVRNMFPQYLFFRNEYADDGFYVSSNPIRLCTCTACGESFEAVRGNYPRGKLHHERCNCPHCGTEVEGIAAHKFKYDMPSLERWIKAAVETVRDEEAIAAAAKEAREKAEAAAEKQSKDYEKKIDDILKQLKNAEKERDKLKKQAETAGSDADTKIAAAEAEAARIRAELEEARKQLKASSADVAKFGVWFTTVQQDFLKMIAALREVRERDPETGEKLHTGAVTLLQNLLERMSPEAKVTGGDNDV